MIKTNIHSLLAFAVFTLIGCKSNLRWPDYITEIGSNTSINKQTEKGEYTLKCKYKPSELIVLEELRTRLNNTNEINKEEFTKEMSKYSNTMYFDIGIMHKDGNIITENAHTQQEYTFLLSELTYNMDRAIYIIADKKDTLRALTYNYSNSYGMSPEIKLVFAFPKKEIENKKEIELVYDDRIFGTNEKMKIQYQVADLTSNLPQLKLN